ncbi:MAG: PEP-CTERM sorting domain-containing protein [Planctomycetota bacterium]
MKKVISIYLLAVLAVGLLITSNGYAGPLTGDVFVLGRDANMDKHVWRFSLDGTYISDVAAANSYAGIVCPGDGYLYGVDVYSGDFTKMAFDGGGKTLIDIPTDPTSVMGDWVNKVHLDGQGGILMSPQGYSTESRTLTRYSTSGDLLASYTGMSHSGGIVGDIAAGKVFSAGAAAWDKALYSFPASGGDRTSINPSVDGGYDMSIDRVNDILFVGYTSSTIEMYDYSGNYLADLTVGQESYSLEYDHISGLLFSGDYSAGTLIAVNMNGSLVHQYSTQDMERVIGIAVSIVPEPSTLLLLILGGVLLTKHKRQDF